MSRISRRSLLALGATGIASAALSACSTTRSERSGYSGTAFPQPPSLSNDPSFGNPSIMYAAVSDNGHDIPAVPYQKIDPRFYRQVVSNPTGEQAGTVVIDTSAHFLYFVANSDEAIRYGVGLGRAGFEWAGRGVIEWKQVWPRWFPPNEMIDRQPELEKYRARQIPRTNEWEGGMEAGVQNPLGARALYIFQNGKDTLYRLHGSPEWASIGKSVSSGCVRLINQDIIDLYGRVADGTPIVVTSGLPAGGQPATSQISGDVVRL
ncbi:L,D-transpeptidase [Aminobacter sp. AP02]|uniref:L,D-transpeptidase n=1 Tax=Aminobacter sp. AP02 TaxID=2135737 RepID=UPI000D6BA319|nr:L,D-transpeptidase [Aminobacter sp. AP02]PWK65280.1 lipoprotein-anchoring transpeptidase ErfK/SrfK [Aminobacter sp. AP02]